MNLLLLKQIDRFVGKALALMLPPASRKRTGQIRPCSILIIRPGGIGDAALLVPALRSLKSRHPDALIDVLAESRNSAVFELCPETGRIFHYHNLRDLLKITGKRYDLIIDTEQWHRLSAVVSRLVRSRMKIGYATNERRRLFTHPVLYRQDEYEVTSFYSLLKQLAVEPAPNFAASWLTVPASASLKAHGLLGNLEGKPFVAMFAGASIPERRWGADKYREVAARLYRQGMPVVVIGGKGDESDGDQIITGEFGLNLAGKTTLVETAAIIECSSLLISGDSGILHIGVGLGKPTVSLFGPGIAKKWAPQGDDHHIVINKCFPCSPCTKFGYTPKCPMGARCMANITVNEVFEAVVRLLQRKK